MANLRLGIIGSGYMASVHTMNIKQIDGVEIAAICDCVADATGFAQDHEIPQVFKDYKQMIDESNLDAIVLTIPPFAHGGEVEYAASKGVNVFLEKPIAISVERGESMAKAVRDNGVKSAVGYHMRFGMAVEKLKDLIDSGIAGRVTLFDARYECNSLHTPWWKDKTKSGGQVFEQVIHLYDMATYFAGKPESVVGLTANLCHNEVEGYTVEDTSSSIIKFESGAIGSICGSNCAIPMQWSGMFTVICKNVTAYFTDPNNARFVYTDKEEPVEELIAGNTNMYSEEMKAFIESINGTQKTVASIENGLESLKLVADVTNSNGRTIYYGEV